MNFILMSGFLLVFSSEINFRVRKKEKVCANKVVYP